MSNNKLSVLSLFSGCGGMDLGFEGGFKVRAESVNKEIHTDWIDKVSDDNKWVWLKKNRFCTKFANDIIDNKKTLWVAYFNRKFDIESTCYHIGSLINLVKEHKNGNKVFPENIDVVTGGFPCQDFSYAGNRMGFDSPVGHDGRLRIDEPTEESRGKLYIWMREVVTICKPKVFVAENVKGLVDLGDAKKIIEHDFRNAAGGGYIVVPARVIKAQDYGVPQSRERVIFFGFRKNALKPDALEALQMDEIPELYDPYPQKTHSKMANDILKSYVTVSDYLDGLDEPEKSSDPAQKTYSKCRFLTSGQGQKEVNLDGIAPTIRSEHHGNIEYRRLSLEHGGKHTLELAAGLNERRLTPRECARLQTFPDDYELVLNNNRLDELNLTDCVAVSASAAYKSIGNAVPPYLAYNIARNLEDKWSLYFK